MCGLCRAGRWKYAGFKMYWGSFKDIPWKRRGEGNPRPYVWLAFWKFDFLISPFEGLDWRYEFTPWGLFATTGVIEFNYISRR